MGWTDLKAAVLAGGGCRIEGELPPGAVARSTAGPGAGGAGAVFFSSGGRRVRIPLGTDGPAVMIVRADGSADPLLRRRDGRGAGRAGRPPLPPAGLRHGLGVVRLRLRLLPGAAVPGPAKDGRGDRRPRRGRRRFGRRDLADERGRGLGRGGGGVRLPGGRGAPPLRPPDRRLDLPDPRHARPAPRARRGRGQVQPRGGHARTLCRVLPRTSRTTTVWDALAASVPLFGRGHVFSNVIVGLGETDDELDACIDRLVGLGVVPVLRPLKPVAGCRDLPRPTPERLVRAARHLSLGARPAGLDPSGALSMCGACTGCDLAAWRDL